MAMTGDTKVYEIFRDGEIVGTAMFGGGEYYSDLFNFETYSPDQCGSVRQLISWMKTMESQGYKFEEP